MKKLLSLWTLLLLAFAAGCNREDVKPPVDGDRITIGISASGIEEVALPTLKGAGADDVFAVQIYSSEAGAGEFAPYARGLFTDWSNLTFEGTKGTDYKIEATLIRDASEKLQKTGDAYGKPLDAAVSNAFAYVGEELTGLADSEATLADGETYAVPTLDRYFGSVTKNVTASGENIVLTMKRVSFGIQARPEETPEQSLVVRVAGAPETEIQPENLSEIILYSFQNIREAYQADESAAPYSESFPVEILSGGKSLFSKEVAFSRNKLSVITIAANGDVSVDIDIEVPFEEKVVVAGDNLYYDETQVGAEQRYWVVLKDRSQEAGTKAVRWFVNGEQRATGAEFLFTPEAAGEYKIGYTVPKAYSATDREVSKEVDVKIYSSNGVYILNEPNMTAAESMRGINRHMFGSRSVDRFVQGDYTSFGTTNQYLANWAGNLYNVAPYGQSGVAFSQFSAADGTFLKAVKTLSGNASAYAFAGVTPEQGVLTSKNGAYLVNLSDLALSDAVLNGSEGAKNVFVADGYLFLITSAGATAYRVDGLTAASEGTVLGAATAGFVQSKDGFIWAANGSDLLRIDPKDLSTETVTLPDGAKIGFSASPWKQCSWVASTADNVFYFLKDSWGTGKEVYKYDIDGGTLTAQFILASRDLDNYMLYSTCLAYDAQRDELICQTLKGYGADGAYSGIHFFDAETGVKSYEVLYNTAEDPEAFGSKDMWFPAMMAPVKNF